MVLRRKTETLAHNAQRVSEKRRPLQKEQPRKRRKNQHLRVVGDYHVDRQEVYAR